MTVLGFGLARFRVGDQDWEFLALPGGLVYFRRQSALREYAALSARAGLRAHPRRAGEEFAAEEDDFARTKQSVSRLEEEMLKRLLEIKPSGEP